MNFLTLLAVVFRHCYIHMYIFSSSLFRKLYCLRVCIYIFFSTFYGYFASKVYIYMQFFIVVFFHIATSSYLYKLHQAFHFIYTSLTIDLNRHSINYIYNYFFSTRTSCSSEHISTHQQKKKHHNTNTFHNPSFILSHSSLPLTLLFVSHPLHNTNLFP